MAGQAAAGRDVGMIEDEVVKDCGQLSLYTKTGPSNGHICQSTRKSLTNWAFPSLLALKVAYWRRDLCVSGGWVAMWLERDMRLF